MRCGWVIKMNSVFITGCSKGIGFQLAQYFLSNGNIVHGTYRSSNAELNQLKEKYQDKFNLHKIDFQNAHEVVTFCNEKLKSIEIQVLINNAGMADRKPFLDLTTCDFQNIFQVNFFSAVSVTQALIPRMIAKKSGKIINIASIGGQWGGTHQVHYAATKAALINFTKSLAKMYSSYGICSNCVSPGSIDTEMIKPELPNDPIGMKNLLEKIPVGRIGTPDDVVSIVDFLSGPKSSYITGQVISVNGGLYFG